jgi:hypothetical protein
VSYDFAVWASDLPLEDDEACAIYQRLVEGDSSGLPRAPALETVQQALFRSWPADAKDPDTVPWASKHASDGAYLIVTVVPSRMPEIFRAIGGLTKEHGLVLYDPQQNAVFLPRRLSRARTRLRAKRRAEAARRSGTPPHK